MTLRGIVVRALASYSGVLGFEPPQGHDTYQQELVQNIKLFKTKFFIFCRLMLWKLEGKTLEIIKIYIFIACR